MTAAFDLPPLDSFSTTIERPLFTQGRRPSALPAVPRKEGARGPIPAQAPKLTVAGIAIAGGRKIALVQMDGARDLLPLPVGGEVAGWTVAEILPDRVRLRRGAEAFEQELRELKRKP